MRKTEKPKEYLKHFMLFFLSVRVQILFVRQIIFKYAIIDCQSCFTIENVCRTIFEIGENERFHLKSTVWYSGFGFKVFNSSLKLSTQVHLILLFIILYLTTCINCHKSFIYCTICKLNMYI